MENWCLVVIMAEFPHCVVPLGEMQRSEALKLAVWIFNHHYNNLPDDYGSIREIAGDLEGTEWFSVLPASSVGVNEPATTVGHGMTPERPEITESN